MFIPRPIFVLGSPRSGTTLIGNFIGSSPKVCNLEEFGGFYLTRYLLENMLMEKMPSRFKENYFEELREHAARFAGNKAIESACKYFLDSTPSNLLIVRRLSEEFSDAIFVLLLRHYSGVVLSLKESFRQGYFWAGRTWEDRAQIWKSFYANVVFLPPERTLVVGYDLLCLQPERTIKKLANQLGGIGFNNNEFDKNVFAISHATKPCKDGPTIGSFNSKKKLLLKSIKSYDEKVWSNDIYNRIKGIVQGIDKLLCEIYPNDYFSPILRKSI